MCSRQGMVDISSLANGTTTKYMEKTFFGVKSQLYCSNFVGIKFCSERTADWRHTCFTLCFRVLDWI